MLNTWMNSLCALWWIYAEENFTHYEEYFKLGEHLGSLYKLIWHVAFHSLKIAQQSYYLCQFVYCLWVWIPLNPHALLCGSTLIKLKKTRQSANIVVSYTITPAIQLPICWNIYRWVWRFTFSLLNITTFGRSV